MRCNCGMLYIGLGVRSLSAVNGRTTARLTGVFMLRQVKGLYADILSHKPLFVNITNLRKQVA